MRRSLLHETWRFRVFDVLLVARRALHRDDRLAVARLQRVRRAWEYLNHRAHLDQHLSEVKLITDGVSIFKVARRNGEIIDALNEGQLAFFVAITDLIPNIGATLGAIPVVGVALFESWWKGLIMLIVIIVYQQAENSIITPKVFQKAIDLHPFLSFVVVLFSVIHNSFLAPRPARGM